jgi:hypothetical protein
MADKKESEKTLEMRITELEDKLKGLQVTEEEMKAYNKVASLMAGGVPQPGAGVEAAVGSVGLTPAPSSCVIQQCVIQQCIRPCTVVQQCIRPCTIRPCTVVQPCVRACTIISDCINECGGGCAPGGGGFIGGGGFGSLGG